MNRIDRLFGILTTLQSKKFVPAENLSRKYRISTRTVYRDIKAIGELGIPVSFEQHRGYFIVQGYFLPPVSFTSDEANALLLIEAVVQGFTDKGIQIHYNSVLSKVKAVMRTTQKERMEELTQNIKLQIPSCLVHDHNFLSQLQEAISMKKRICIEYSNKAGETDTRVVEPIGLIFYALNWHLIAWCTKRNAYRDFKVARIRNLDCIAEAFEKTDHISLEEYRSQIPVDF